MRNVFYALFITLFFAQGYCQTAYKLKAEPGEALKNELIKHVDSMFLFNSSFTYNLSTKHIYAYKFIKKDEMLQEGYLDNQIKLLNKSPGDAVIYNNIALYHQRKGDTLLAKEYYTKALTNLKLRPGAKDSAYYYSFRGVVKFNLKQDGVQDIEKALSINKSDSIAIAFYPMMLINNGDFDKSREVLKAALKAKKDNYFAYLMLVLTDFYQTSMGLDFATEKGKKKIEETDIEKIIDLSVYDSYVDKDNRLFVQTREMQGVYNVLLKFCMGFETSWKPSEKDIAFVVAKEKYFNKLLSQKNVNTYGVYLSLGTLSLLQKKYTEAEKYFEKALEVFPKELESYDFNTLDAYENLATAYYMDKKMDKALEIMAKAMEVKSLGKIAKKDLLLKQARLLAQLGNFEKAIDMTQEAKEISEDFDVDFLLSYLYARSDSGSLAQRYIEKARQRATMEKESCDMLTYMTVFYISNGYLDEARSLFDQNKNNFVDYKCEDCEKILVKYLIPNN
jgi:tetratricopeptide (TPR) repeat protein